jgi:hypothetical protein
MTDPDWTPRRRVVVSEWLAVGDAEHLPDQVDAVFPLLTGLVGLPPNRQVSPVNT